MRGQKGGENHATCKQGSINSCLKGISKQTKGWKFELIER